MGEITIFALTLLGAGVLFVSLGIPLFQQRVPPNYWYGCRTTKCLSDRKIWYAVNRITGKSMMMGGVIMLATSILMFALRKSLRPDNAAMLAIAVLLLGTAFLVINSLRAQKQF
jgi:uncharacterized membrane protein